MTLMGTPPYECSRGWGWWHVAVLEVWDSCGRTVLVTLQLDSQDLPFTLRRWKWL